MSYNTNAAASLYPVEQYVWDDVLGWGVEFSYVPAGHPLLEQQQARQHCAARASAAVVKSCVMGISVEEAASRLVHELLESTGVVFEREDGAGSSLTVPTGSSFDHGGCSATD